MSLERPNYISELNDMQRQGVIHTKGPCMIIAGAGSGKTRVLTYRIAHLIQEHDVDPFHIMALTFTNKAAKEMRHRIETIVSTEARNLWMGTFHAVFARILRAESSRIGYTSGFSIYDTDDSKTLIKLIVKEFDLDDKIYKPNVIYNRISGAKNRLISSAEYTSNPLYYEDDKQNMRPEMGKIYHTYTTRCFGANAMDFDDLLFNTNILFKNHIDVLNKYQHRFQHILIDEFQDTNLSQYLIAKRLAAVHQNICVVGDDAQSIYAFRGADIQNILHFEKDYPDLKVIRLEQNYRSTQNIVNAANSVISKNKAQLKKNVWTSNEPGELIAVTKANSDNEEGRSIASTIFEVKMKEHVNNKSFAILYRTNSQSRSIEEALRRNHLKYRIVGGLSFYQRKEIKNLLAYFRYVVNPNDETALRRIINLPRRGIGPGTINKIVVAAEENKTSLWNIMLQAKKYIGSNAAAMRIDDFVHLIKSMRITAEKKDAFDTASKIAKSSGILKELYEDKTVEGISRYENTQELLNAIKAFSEEKDTESGKLAHFLQEITLLTDEDKHDSTDDVITLMTIHMSKGLEFDYVLIAGMEEDLFPSQMMLQSRADLEEERRLFYVALTRAKKRLFLTYATNRFRFGRLKTCEPSRFLEELDAAYLHVDRKHSMDNTATTNRHNFTRNFVKNIELDASKNKSIQRIQHTISEGFEPSNPEHLEEGMKIEHAKFGYGVILSIEKMGVSNKANINFELVGKKTLLLKFAKLRIVT